MDGRRAAISFVALLAGSLLLLLAASYAPRYVSTLLEVPWVVAIGGPLAIFLLREPGARSGLALARPAALVLPGSTVALLVVDSFRALAPLRDRADLDADTRMASIALHVLIIAVGSVAGAYAWRSRAQRDERGLVASAIVCAALVMFPPGLVLVIGALVASQALLLVGAAGWRPSPRQLARGIGLAALLLVLEVVALLAIAGSVWPPSVNLDGRQAGVILPLGLALPALVLAASLSCARGRPYAPT